MNTTENTISKEEAKTRYENKATLKLSKKTTLFLDEAQSGINRVRSKAGQLKKSLSEERPDLLSGDLAGDSVLSKASIAELRRQNFIDDKTAKKLRALSTIEKAFADLLDID